LGGEEETPKTFEDGRISFAGYKLQGLECIERSMLVEF